MASARVRTDETPATFFEDISQYLRAERLFEITADVEAGGFLAARRRAVGRDDHAGEAAPAIVGGERPQQLGAAHHRHVDVGQEQLHVGGLENGERLGAVARLEDFVDGHVGELDDALDHLAHHRRVVRNQDPHRYSSLYAAPL